MNQTQFEDLLSNDPEIRREAAAELGVREADELEPEDYYVAVVDRLSYRHDEGAMGILHRLLGHPEPLVQASAAGALVARDPELGVPVLEALLLTDDRKVRHVVVESLCRIRTEECGRLLAQILWSLYQSRHTIDPCDDWTRDLRRSIVNTLGDICHPYALNSLGQAITDVDPGIRARAALALGLIMDKRAVPVLVKALDDKDDRVRFEAVEALGLLGDRSVSAALLRKLDDPEPAVVAAAATGLGWLGDAEAVPRLLRLVEGESDRIARAAFRSLRQIGYVVVVRELVAKLESPNTDVRTRSVVVALLGLTGGSEALPPLLTALWNRAVPVKIAAARALGRLANRRATGYLADVLEDDQPAAVHKEVVRALGELGNPSVRLALLQASKSRDRELARAAELTLVRLGLARFEREQTGPSQESGRTRAPHLLLRAGRFGERL